MSKIVVLGSYAPSLINFRGHLLKEMVNLNHKVYACAPSIDDTIFKKLCDIGVVPISSKY